MPGLTEGAKLIIDAFKKHAHKEGNKETLTKRELKDLLNEDLGGFLGEALKQGPVWDIFTALDMNQDNTVDFKEFMSIICMVVSCSYEQEAM